MFTAAHLFLYWLQLLMSAEQRSDVIVMSTRSTDKTYTDDEDDLVDIFSDEEAAALFERMAQHYLSISGEEFLRRWDTGYYSDDPDRPGIMDMAMLIPLVRH